MEKTLVKISLFYCSNNLSSEVFLKSTELNKKYTIKLLSLSCSGRLNIQYLLKAIEAGADGVVLVICPQEACQFLEGNLRAKKRVLAVNSILKETGYENDRVRIVQPSANDSTEQILEKIIATCNTISNIPQERNITV